MGTFVIALDEGLDRIDLGDVDTLFRGDQDLMAAAVDGCARLDADKTPSALGILMLLHLQSTHYSPAMQPLVMVPHLLLVVLLLVGKVPFGHELSGKVIVALEWLELAFGRDSLASLGLFLCHLEPLPSSASD